MDKEQNGGLINPILKEPMLWELRQEKVNTDGQIKLNIKEHF